MLVEVRLHQLQRRAAHPGRQSAAHDQQDSQEQNIPPSALHRLGYRVPARAPYHAASDLITHRIVVAIRLPARSVGTSRRRAPASCAASRQ